MVASSPHPGVRRWPRAGHPVYVRVLCYHQVHTFPGRVLVCMSFAVGLFLSSFVVTVLFEAVSVSEPEKFLLGKLEFKRSRKSLVHAAAVLIQRLVQLWLARRRLGKRLFGSPLKQRSLYVCNAASA